MICISAQLCRLVECLLVDLLDLQDRPYPSTGVGCDPCFRPPLIVLMNQRYNRSILQLYCSLAVGLAVDTSID